ncbi:hypothetical protein POL68_27450 [Stigmatella sp. ncwal1]|uniref:Uncharacterized protein n=1 Tax=Stigmatella ashevillensis TaxID=2995309 RepID=A0ABT5DF85_9BACT|nr:hypothetical protein [Stigmatella ashevillena]MDC0712234.1 hypothetical protein [Stigmatella ashevillena]
MATQEKKQPADRPRQEPPEAETSNAGKRAHTENEEDDQEREALGRGGINDIPDGDGPRSDRGTNPLPGVYWTSYPGD